MFQKNELKNLRAKKDLLVLQSETNRLLMAVEWQHLRSPENWMKEAGGLAGRYPVWTAVLAAAAGAMAFKAVRLPGGIAGGIDRLGKFASLALTVWKLFRRKSSEG